MYISEARTSQGALATKETGIETSSGEENHEKMYSNPKIVKSARTRKTVPKPRKI
jgi:hypothetical protein